MRDPYRIPQPPRCVPHACARHVSIPKWVQSLPRGLRSCATAFLPMSGCARRSEVVTLNACLTIAKPDLTIQCERTASLLGLEKAGNRIHPGLAPYRHQIGTSGYNLLNRRGAGVDVLPCCRESWLRMAHLTAREITCAGWPRDSEGNLSA